MRLVGDQIKHGAPLAQECVTGVVAGVFGTETPDGDFQVSAMQFAGPPAPMNGAKDEARADAESAEMEGRSPEVLLVSGLDMGGTDEHAAKNGIYNDLLLEWTLGELGPEVRARI